MTVAGHSINWGHWTYFEVTMAIAKMPHYANRVAFQLNEK
jgi:hypothetical protein